MLQLNNLSVRLDSFALEDISMEILEGDYVALLGVSGAGKTVLLEVLAGLLKPAGGEVVFQGRDITNASIQHRRIGLVYQDLSLFPHLSVLDNILYPLRGKGNSWEAMLSCAEALAKETGIGYLLKRYPSTLSGGEAQRVALARTLAADPDILLLDEPLSNLDVKTKTGLRALLRRIHLGGKTIIHVTHDFMEAATLANKVAVIEQGRLAQFGTPAEVFRHPKTEFVARFSGIKNLFPCQVKQRRDDPGMSTALIGPGVEVSFLGQCTSANGYVMIPQEDIILSEQPVETSAVNNFRGDIQELYLSGNGMEVVVDVVRPMVVSVSRQSAEKMQLAPGKTVWLAIKASAVRFIES